MPKDRSIFTNTGKELILDAAGSKAKITYTKAVLAYDHAQDHSGDYYNKITKLDDIRKEVPISISTVDNSTIKLGASFSNKDVHSNIFYNVVGWYAKTDTQDEILVAVTVPDAGELTPTDADNGGATLALDYYLNFVVDDAENVVINAYDSGMVTHPEMNIALASKADKEEVNIYKKDAINNPSIDILNSLTRSFQYVTNLSPLDVLNAGSSNRPINALVITIGGDKYVGLQIIIGEDGQLFGRNKKGDMWYPFSTVNAGLAQGVKVLFEDPVNTENLVEELNDKVSSNKGEIDLINNTKIPSIQELITAIKSNMLTKAGNDVVSVNTQRIKDLQSDSNSLNSKIEKVKNDDQTAIANLNSTAVKKVNNATPDGNGNVNVHSQIVRGYDIVTKKSTSRKDETIGGSWLVDQNALGGIADAINKINGNTKRTNATDVNTLTATGLYILQNSSNTNTPSFFSEKRGDLVVFNFEGNAKTQVWFPVGTSGRESTFAIRYWEGNSYGTWHKVPVDTDLDNLNDSIDQINNTTIPSLRTEFTEKLDSYIGYSSDRITSPSDDAVAKYPQGIKTVYNFAPSGLSFTCSGHLITIKNPLSSWRWTEQFFIGVQGQLGYRLIDGGTVGKWNFMTDSNGNPASRGLEELFKLQSRVTALEKKIK